MEIEKELEITEKDAPTSLSEQLGTYHLRRWTWYEKQQAVARATTIIDESKALVSMPVADYYAEMMAVTVRKAPDGIEWGVNFIKSGLDPMIGDILRDACRDLNGLTDLEKRLFLEQSELEKDIPT